MTEEQLQVKADYLASLSDLTFNSRPIINTLSMIAGESPDYAPVFVDAIHEYCLKTRHKLPVIYLIDSICKNHTQIYVPLFASHVEELFVRSYLSLPSTEEKTRNDFKRVLQTWNGLFAPEVISSIERRIDRDRSRQQPPAQERPRLSQHSLFERQPPPERPPSDLPAYARNDPQYSEQRLLPRQPSMHHRQPQIERRPRRENPSDITRPSDRRDPKPNSMAILSELQSLLKQTRPLSSPQAPNPQALASPEELPHIDLSQEGLQKRVFNASHYIYGRLALQCNQCGLRFPSSSQSILDAHLDQHFRLNKRLTERGSHVLCRSWFLPEQEWILTPTITTDDTSINDRASAFFGQESGPVSQTTEQSTVSMSQFQSISRSTQPIPTCSICSEAFKTAFDPDADDTILYDASIVNNGSTRAVLHTWCAASLGAAGTSSAQ